MKTEECLSCHEILPEDEGCVIMTRAATGPSWSSAGGDPPEYDWVCFECQDAEALSEYDYDPCEEDLWDVDLPDDFAW